MEADPRLAPVYDLMSRALAPEGDHRDGLYHWLRYQLGWAEPDGSPADLRTAKGVRPLICLLASRAVGGSDEAAVPAAASIELTHEFSLIHDDIEDGDRTRRGRAALWTITGIAQGINSGDALFGIARSQLALSPVTIEILVDLYRRYDQACVRLTEGQYLDLMFESSEGVTVDSYVDMVSRKTGALIAAASSLGARAGGASPMSADALGRYGASLGIAFQIQDDVLGLWGDPERTGKPVGADIERRKKSLPVLAALADPSLAPDLADLYRTCAPSGEQARSMAMRMEQAGIRDQAADMAGSYAESARQELERLDLAAEPRHELMELVRWVVRRDH
jgi:geranylgeranyl diphosphate synthase type I